MAPVTPKSKTIQHFTHPNHPLLEVYQSTEYFCDGCKTLGFGLRYRCNMCDFDLHDHCSKCPLTLPTFMHPQHHLALVVRKPQGTRQNERVCDVCGDNVLGLFYRCKLCDFDVHPLCTQLPANVHHAVHPHHLLTLLPWSPSVCAICRGVCAKWRYRCGPCGVDLHPDCVVASFDAKCPPSPAPSSHASYNAYAYARPSPSSYGIYSTPNHGQGSGAISGRKMGEMYSLVGKLAMGALVNGMFGSVTDSLFS